MRALSGRSRVAAIIVPCGLQKVRRKRNRRNAGAISTQPVYVQTLVSAMASLPPPRGGASSGQPSFWAAHARTIRVYVTWRAESQVQEQVEKLNGSRIRRSKPDRIEYGSPARRKSAQRLEHDPEKWIPVFGYSTYSNTSDASRPLWGGVRLNLQGSPELPAGGRLLPSVGCLNWRPSPTNIRYFAKLGARSKHH